MARYIDADYLISKLKERYDSLVYAYEIWDAYTQGFCEALDKVEDLSHEPTTVELTEKWEEACEKQIPKKPKMDEYEELCPVCGNLLCMVIDEPQKYCDECGQRIDWGNDDDKK